MTEAITNAPAPIIGGMSCPPVDAAASTPPANLALKPAFFINGIVITPVEAVFATAEPEIIPVNADENMATNPGPPVILSATQRDSSMMKSPPPERSRNAPNKINIKTKLEEIVAILPSKASSPKVLLKSTVSKFKPLNFITPGIKGPSHVT